MARVHNCLYKKESERLTGELEAVRKELAEMGQTVAELKKQVFGRKSEKMPPMAGEVRKKRPPDPEQGKALRRERAAARETLQTEVVPIPLSASDRCCPNCGKDALKSVGAGTPSVVYEHVAAHFRKRVYLRETAACACGEYIATAPPPDRISDRCPYAPSFVAHLVVAKCDDGIPLYRLEKQYARSGVPIARSTMTDLFHRAAESLAPISRRILERVGQSPIVFADETTIKMQSSPTRAYFWVFLSDTLAAFDFSTSRSGDTPHRVLGDSTGELMVDLYTGYNQVTAPGRRTRAGCLAHARRKVFAAKEMPEAEVALGIIRDIYVVEHDVREAGCQGTPAHLEIRRQKSRPLMARLLWWARAQARQHPPKSVMGRAARYIARNHKPLCRFLYVAALPPDNNRSEAALRRVALGRKNYLFVGHEDAGKNIAGLFSIIASCAANGINPLDYLTDVLVRVDTHPHRKLDELLPDRWRPPPR